MTMGVCRREEAFVSVDGMGAVRDQREKDEFILLTMVEEREIVAAELRGIIS